MEQTLPKTHERADRELLRVTREIARLLRERSRLDKRKKQVAHDLRLARAELRALIGRLAPEPDIAPMRLFSGAVGIKSARNTHKDNEP